MRVSIKVWFLSYVLFNVLLICGYLLSSKNVIGAILWRLSFPYCSPLLIVNSLLFFFIFIHLPLRSRVVNYLAKSSLAIYLIHESTPLILEPIGRIAISLYNIISNSFCVLIALVFFSILIASVAIAIDKCLTPIWKSFNLLGERISIFTNQHFS